MDSYEQYLQDKIKTLTQEQKETIFETMKSYYDGQICVLGSALQEYQQFKKEGKQ